MTEATEVTSRGELRRLTSIRGIAAGLVFLYHVGKDAYWLPQGWIVSTGFAGVTFFFVLSGFVLTWSFRGRSSREFWTRRFARVYPSHFVTALIAMVVPVTAYPVTAAAIAVNLPLIQSWFTPWPLIFSLNAVSWSLSCEAFFYLLAPWVIRWANGVSSRRMVVGLGAWFVLGLVVSVAMGFASQSTDIIAYTNPAIRSGEFVLGIMLALLVQRGWRPRLPLWAPTVLAAVVVVGTAALRPPQSATDMALVGPFAAVILAAAVADLNGRPGVLTHRIAHYLGRVSFAFYLVHELVILNVAALVPDTLGRAEKLLMVVAVLVIGLATASLLHHQVEMRFQKLILDRALGRTRARGISESSS